MNVDALTTGAGTYAHSFILSLLSHLGIVGFSLFLTYIIYSFKELKNLEQLNGYFKNIWRLYFIILFCGIFFISNIGTFFIYMTIWFLFGVMFCPIKLKML